MIPWWKDAWYSNTPAGPAGFGAWAMSVCISAPLSVLYFSLFRSDSMYLDGISARRLGHACFSCRPGLLARGPKRRRNLRPRRESGEP
jgi:hypothetical protein